MQSKNQSVHLDLLGPRYIGMALATGALTHILLLIPTLITLQIYDRVLSNRNVSTLLMLLLCAAIALVCWWISEAGRARWFSALGAQLDQEQSKAIALQTLQMNLQGASSTAQQVWSDVGAIRAFAASPIAVALFDLPWSVVYLLVLTAFHPLLGLAALGGIVFLMVLAWATEKRLSPVVASADQDQQRAHFLSQEVNSFAEVLHAHGQQNQVAASLLALRANASESRLRADIPGHNLKTLSKLVRQVLQIGMLALGAWLVMQNQATGGVMIAGSILLGKALGPMDVLIGSWKILIEIRKSHARISQLVTPRIAAAMREPETQLPEPKGELRINALYIKAPQSDRLLLSNISLAIPAGATLVVLGASGSGKSTLARALVGAIAPTKGEILIDGASLYQYGSKERGEFTGYLPQDIQLHSGSVAHNISRQWLPSADAQAEDKSGAITEAARLSGAHDTILALPAGYDTQIGKTEGAVPLSGGQRQRIALARAVYGYPRLVVLDEPNSQLDAEGFKALQKCLLALREQKCTVILITHNPGLIEFASHILLLRQGSVEEFGTKDKVRQYMMNKNKTLTAQSPGNQTSMAATKGEEQVSS